VQPAPPVQVEPPPPPPSAPVAPPPVIQAPQTAPVVTAAPNRTTRNPPVASFNVPSVIPREGVPYRIRYGDTLWDISEAFYRNPWLYPRIARFNNIRNPDLIISGALIRVPPRN
jgi:nucleoid-associated protein YgaU